MENRVVSSVFLNTVDEDALTSVIDCKCSHAGDYKQRFHVHLGGVSEREGVVRFDRLPRLFAITRAGVTQSCLIEEVQEGCAYFSWFKQDLDCVVDWLVVTHLAVDNVFVIEDGFDCGVDVKEEASVLGSIFGISDEGGFA